MKIFPLTNSISQISKSFLEQLEFCHHRALANLPAPELEDTLHGVHVAPEQVRHRAVTEGRVQIKGLAGLRDRGLALDDAQNQGCFGHGCPALDVVFHQGAHRRFLSR